MNKLTKLDKFAIELVNAMIIRDAINLKGRIMNDTYVLDLSRQAYQMAQAMLKESEKQNKSL